MSQLFGFPSGLSGGSTETEYTTNRDTDQTTDFITNWTTSFNTSWTDGVWQNKEAPSSYASYYTGTGNNDTRLYVRLDNGLKWWEKEGMYMGPIDQIFDGVICTDRYGNGGVLARATSPYTAWGSHDGWPYGWAKGYHFYVQVFSSSDYSQQTSIGTSRSTSKITIYSTDYTTAHITYG